MGSFNVVAIIGNGFDLAVLDKYRKDGVTTRYDKFCDFLAYKNFDKENVVYKRMLEDKKEGKEDWCDFEKTIEKLAIEGEAPKKLDASLNTLVEYFYMFIDEVVTSDINMKLNNDSKSRKLGENSIRNFLSDLDKEEYHRIIGAIKTVSNYTEYEFSFLNLNYTYLFDNYIHLGKAFDPHPYASSENNMNFQLNPKGYFKEELRKFSDPNVKLISNQVLHPHGSYNIPNSLLFGTANKEFNLNNNERKRLNKSYWLDNSRKYKNVLEGADLIIIFGSSLGKSDSWWWDLVCSQLLTKNSHLIIYRRNSPGNVKTADEVRELFIQSSGKDPDLDEKKKIMNRIAVKLYEGNDDHYFCGLGYKKKE